MYPRAVSNDGFPTMHRCFLSTDPFCYGVPSFNVNQHQPVCYFFWSLHYDYAVSFASCFFPAFLFCFVFLSSSALLVRSDIYATEPRSIAPQRCGCVPTLVFCMGSMSPTLFLYVSFCLVFCIVPSAFLSCRVLKQDYPTCVASNQATHHHLPFLVVFPRCIDVSCLLTPSSTVCQVKLQHQPTPTTSLLFPWFFFGWLHYGLRCFVFELFPAFVSSLFCFPLQFRFS
eukprot:g25748.t1